MAQPHKGDRRLIAVRTPVEVAAVVEREAHRVGRSMSEVVSDILCGWAGRDDLIISDHQEALIA